MSRSLREYGRLGRRLVSSSRDFNSLLAFCIKQDSSDFEDLFSKMHITDGSSSFVISSALKAMDATNIDPKFKQIIKLLLSPMVRGNSEGNSPERFGAQHAYAVFDEIDKEAEPVEFSDNLTEIQSVVEKVSPRAAEVLSFVAEATTGLQNPMMSDGARLVPAPDKKNLVKKHQRPSSSMSTTSLQKKKQQKTRKNPPASYFIRDMKKAATGLCWPDLEESELLKKYRYSPAVQMSDDTVQQRMNKWALHGNACECCARFTRHVPMPDEEEDWQFRGALRDSLAWLHCYSQTEQSYPIDVWIAREDLDRQISKNHFAYGTWAESDDYEL